MVVSSRVSDALFDFAAALKRYPGRASDFERAASLRLLGVDLCVAFDSWVLDDVLIFSLRTFPEEILQKTALARKPSEYLRVLYGLWKPDMKAWLVFLRRLCSLHSFRLFVDVVRVNHFQTDLNVLSQALFADLPRLTTILPPHYPPIEDIPGLPHNGTPFGEDLLEAVVASFVKRPHDISCSRRHADHLLTLTGGLGPMAVGDACRRLLLFLTRNPPPIPATANSPIIIHCFCDMPDKPRNAECLCPRKMDMDVRKEYARVLFQNIFNKHAEEPDVWSITDKQDFLMQACKYRFSALVYEELSVILGATEPGEEPRPNPYVRPYTKQEMKDCYHANDSAVQHAGCAEINCKHCHNTDCMNMMCGTHCRLRGSNPCSVAKHNQNVGVESEDLLCLCCRPHTVEEEEEVYAPLLPSLPQRDRQGQDDRPARRESLSEHRGSRGDDREDDRGRRTDRGHYNYSGRDDLDMREERDERSDRNFQDDRDRGVQRDLHRERRLDDRWDREADQDRVEDSRRRYHGFRR
jgi:hypothetical protein